jgi:hypothetical protein
MPTCLIKQIAFLLYHGGLLSERLFLSLSLLRTAVKLDTLQDISPTQTPVNLDTNQLMRLER